MSVCTVIVNCVNERDLIITLFNLVVNCIVFKFHTIYYFRNILFLLFSFFHDLIKSLHINRLVTMKLIISKKDG